MALINPPILLVWMMQPYLVGLKLIKATFINIYNDDAYIVIKDSEYHKLNNPDIGATFEVNDYRGVVVGIGKALLMDYLAHLRYIRRIHALFQIYRQHDYTISYILVEPKTTNDIPYIKKQVKAIGYSALTQDEFVE